MWNKWSDHRKDKIGTCSIPEHCFLSLSWKVLTLVSRPVPVSNPQFLSFFVFRQTLLYVSVCVSPFGSCRGVWKSRGSWKAWLLSWAGSGRWLDSAVTNAPQRVWWEKREGWKDYLKIIKGQTARGRWGKYTDLDSPEKPQTLLSQTHIMRGDQRDFRAPANVLLMEGIARKKGLVLERKIMNTQEHSSPHDMKSFSENCRWLSLFPAALVPVGTWCWELGCEANGAVIRGLLDRTSPELIY